MTDRAQAGQAPAEDILETLACEIGVRPAEAPHFQHVEHAVLATHREQDSLLVDYSAEVAPTLERIVEAERLCCAEIGWSLDPASDGKARLRITAAPEQLDALEELFSSSVP